MDDDIEIVSWPQGPDAPPVCNFCGARGEPGPAGHFFIAHEATCDAPVWDDDEA